MPYPKKRKSRGTARTELPNKRSKVSEDDMLRRMASSAVHSAVPIICRHSVATPRLPTNLQVRQIGNATSERSGTSNSAKPEALLFGRDHRRRSNNRIRPHTHQQPNRRGGEDRGKPRGKNFAIAKPLAIHNEEYLCNNFQLPSAAEYRLAAEPVDTARDILRIANLVYLCNSQNERASVTQFTHKFSIKYELDDNTIISAFGHGRTKQQAEANAALHAICLFHAQGLFRDILPGGKHFGVSQVMVSTDTNAKKDVIDYAARHDCVPSFDVRQSRSQLGPTLKLATITIPALDLTTSARAKSAKDAVAKACIRMKQVAESRHEELGEGLLLVKDYTKLTSVSSKKFVEYYCYGKKMQFDVQSKQRGDWTATVTLRDRSVGGSQTDIPPPTTDPSDATAMQVFQGMPMENKRDAEDMAFLVASLELKKDEALWMSFVSEMKRGNGEVLKALRPIELNLDHSASEIMRQTIQDVDEVQQSAFKDSTTKKETVLESQMLRNNSRQLSEEIIEQKSQALKIAYEQYMENPELSELRRKRSELPMVQYRDQVLSLVKENEVCVVVGATGSGKTTQLPQLILEDMIAAGRGGECNIVCTQPRRIAAISVAQRVSVERNEPLQDSVGYAVRFDNKPPKFGGSVNYCTTGILLRQLQDSQQGVLDGLSHIIIDEVHERDIQIDFLLVILRQIMADRKSKGLPAIKVILMSATIDTTLFCKYFGAGFDNGRCPYIEVPGRTFPVTQHFLNEIHPLLTSEYKRQAAPELYSRDTEAYVSRELRNPPILNVPAPVAQITSDLEDDSDKARINWKSKGMVGEDGELDVVHDKEDSVTPVGLMSVMIAHLLKTTTEGSILAFMPGFQEITALNRLLMTTRPLGVDFTNNEHYKIYMLHSAIPQMQQEVFEKLPAGQRKIIISTNIAETSITIPDVVYVVDSSKHRETQYDPAKRIASLISTWTSKSNAKQRAGRAGRVQHGHYYTMASEARYESFEVAPQPEILRTELQELCLQIKGMGVESIATFLQEAIQPPASTSVETSIEHLQALGALDDGENLTPLGKLLATLPVQPSIGKMVILGIIFKCLDPILILAAASAAKDPFLSPIDSRSAADATKAQWAKGTRSDHAAIVNAFSAWRNTRSSSLQEEKQFAYDNFLHRNTLVSITQTAEQILEIMQKSGLVASDPRTRGSRKTVKARFGTEEENRYADSFPLVAALSTAGFYPNVAVQTTNPKQLQTAHENATQIHMNSLAAPKSASGNKYGPIAYSEIQPYGTLYTFSQKTQADGNTVNLRGVSKASSMSVILFGSKLKQQGSILRVDGWIPFYARPPSSSIVTRISKLLTSYLEDTFDRLGTANQKRLLAQSNSSAAFLAKDDVRDPLISGIVQLIECCAPKDYQSRSTVAESYSKPSASASSSYTPLRRRTDRDDGSPRDSRKGRGYQHSSRDARQFQSSSREKAARNAESHLDLDDLFQHSATGKS